MDYKYIEQLLERYWRCETTEQEEDILRAFFAQDNIPASLAKYRDLFDYQNHEVHSAALSSDFDERLCRQLGIADEGEMHVRAHRITLTERLQPYYHAAAAVAVVALLGTGAQHIFSGHSQEEPWDYNPNTYQDSYDNPRDAYENLDLSIRELQEVLGVSDADSLAADTATRENNTNVLTR